MKKNVLVIIVVISTLFFSGCFGGGEGSIPSVTPDGWNFLSSETAWSSDSHSSDIYIYYKEGNGEKKYAYSLNKKRGPSSNNLITANQLYRSQDCNDFRSGYQYKAGSLYFDCNYSIQLPACKDGWVFHSTATAWYSATESRIVFIYYKEGNGERKYGYSIREDCVPDWDDNVTTNYLYNSRDCDDFRKNYRYMAGPCWYFGDNVDLHISSDINEWKFYSTATAWHSATEPVIIYIFYKEGNGRRKYYYSTENGKNPHWLDLVERNEEYNNGNYSDYRSRYPYKAGYRVFDLPGFSL